MIGAIITVYTQVAVAPIAVWLRQCPTTREVPSHVSLLVDAESSPSEALSGVAEALDASVGALESVVTCPAEAPIDPCRIAPGVAVVAFRSLEPHGESPRFEVRLWQHDAFREEVHHSVVGVALGCGSEGWEVTEVLFRAANRGLRWRRARRRASLPPP
jgi:hypothetical protein